MNKKTRKQRIIEFLIERPGMRPSDIRNALSDYKIESTPDEIIEHIKEINNKDEIQIQVAPPECKDCGFDNWDNIVNIPSQCPECRSEWIEEPLFKIDS